MKNITYNICFSFFLALLFSLVSSRANAQSRDYDSKFGLQINGTLGITEFYESNDYKISYLGRAFYRFELAYALETEIGAGYGKIQGLDFVDNFYQTELIPIDLRLILRPFKLETFNPYLYGGVGILRYKVTDFPISQQNSEESGWKGIIPFGVGFEIGLSESLILDISGGVTYSLTDYLNYYANDAAKDAYATVGVGLTFVGGSGISDNDKDGLTKTEEKALGTDYNNSDTDGDGLNDGEEVNKYATSPKNPDSDNDGLKDGEEVNKYSTSPGKADTDGDELSDGDEVNKYKTDPLKVDTDADGLSDGDEVTKYKTDPLKADTDGDGLSDGDEVAKYKTDPLKADTDGDGLSDGDEVTKYKTDPLNMDTDGGTVSDYTEVMRGTNPLDVEDDIVKINVPMVLEGVTFASGKYDITPESAAILEKSYNTLKTYEDIIVEIRGYTDNVGRKSSNIKLSQNRADAVRNWLVSKGIDGSRIRAVGYGPDNPIAPNDTPENKRKNRRIEFVRVK